MTALQIGDRVEIVETGHVGELRDVRVDVEVDPYHEGPDVRMRPREGSTRYGVMVDGRKVWLAPSEVVRLPSTFPIGGGWGRHVEWLRHQCDDLRVHGHWSPVPRLGDVVTSEMSSGRTGRFRITTIDVPSDPGDQFFADVEFIGYVP